MPEFLELISPHDALSRLLLHLPPPESAPETVPTFQAFGRVVAQAVHSPEPLPAFTRSTVDGFAVRAADTFGANDSLPAYLTVAGEVPMGGAPGFSLEPAQAAAIHTGGMLPDEADAVVMLEYTQAARPGEVEIFRAVAPGENVVAKGEDVQPGDVILPAGVRLSPAHVGGLAALGIMEISVASRPVVGILSSGDEIVPPEQSPLPGQVRDVNSHSLSALVEQHGAYARRYGILPDRSSAIYECLQRALAECALVVITAGSSASTRDLTAQVISRVGAPGVLVHGVNVKPGKPTILGVCSGKAVIGLPGNPVSALVIARLFVVPVIHHLLGLPPRLPEASLVATLAANVPSQAGREDYCPVRLVTQGEQIMAQPIHYKSNLIFNLARANGLARIPADATGLEAGAQVEVLLL